MSPTPLRPSKRPLPTSATGPAADGGTATKSPARRSRAKKKKDPLPPPRQEMSPHRTVFSASDSSRRRRQPAGWSSDKEGRPLRFPGRPASLAATGAAARRLRLSRALSAGESRGTPRLGGALFLLLEFLRSASVGGFALFIIFLRRR